MKIVAIQVLAEDLRPGDLFSTAGPEYWDNLPGDTVGERVYVRTDVPAPEDQLKVKIYRVTVENKEDR